MKMIVKKIAFILLVFMFASFITSCELLGIVGQVVELGATVVGATAGAVGAIASAAESYARASKDEFPLINLKRISKGVYTVEISALEVKYKEAVRNNAINLLVQFMGYESYDFKMTSEPNFKKKGYSPVWKYSITMPGSIPVVRNDKFNYKIADTACTIVKDFGNSAIKRIAYGDGKFVATLENRGVSGMMLYSSDGITWTGVNIKKTNLLEDALLGNLIFEDVAYGNGKFVAVGWSSGRFNRGGKISYSPDGVNWTDVKTTPFKKENIGNIVYGNGMFVAATKYDNGKLAYSTDGENWTEVKKFPFKRKYFDIAYGGGQFFVFNFSDGKLACSSDCVIWTAVNNILGKKDCVRNLVYGNDKFVAVGYERMAYSSDGVKWEAKINDIYVPMFSNNSNVSGSIVYGDGKFVAAGAGGKMAYSLDGISWITIADSTFDSSDINDVVYADGKFFIVGNDGKMAYWDGNIE